MSAQRQSRLLTLPSELRQQIYREYIYLDAEEGYTYDFEAGKLRTASPDKRPIDLNLMYTCRLVANEMRGLALRIQTIRFSTLYSPELRIRAAKWEWLVYAEHFGAPPRWHVPLIAEYADDEMWDEITRRHSGTLLYQYMSHLRDYEEGGSCWGVCWNVYPRFEAPQTQGWGEAPSLYRETLTDIFELAMSDPDLRADIYQNELRYLPRDAPWQIPTEKEIDLLAKNLMGVRWKTSKNRHHRDWHESYWNLSPGKYRFSAAASAIHFLKSVPRHVRAHIRNIVLFEDHLSVASPESHIRGLIPFCHENSALRIERRAALWRNVFLWGNYFNEYFLWHRWTTPTTYSEFWNRGKPAEERGLPRPYLSRRLAQWMAEAARPDIPDNITLLFDGDLIVEHTAKVFRDVVHLAAAVQESVDKALRIGEPGINPDEALEKRIYSPFWQCDGFPRLLKEMCENHGKKSSFRIRCNFDPGCPVNEYRTSQILDAFRKEDYLWLCGVWSPYKEKVNTVSPLPCYYALWKKNLLPEGEQEWT
ncbi:hypothetical protein QBC43DRAFT_370079 [Cladorrhinum sp. PSN259]|nr:hypothetical protein QBC43DRAFT_370079 [Cladorrhinum sp. PSN259]